jgi:hypothetical protein
VTFFTLFCVESIDQPSSGGLHDYLDPSRSASFYLTLEGHKGKKDYDARIIAGLGLTMIAVVIAVCTVAVGSGVDATNLQLMSVFP